MYCINLTESSSLNVGFVNVMMVVGNLMLVNRSNAGPDPSPRLSKQLCFRSQGSLANKLTGEGDSGDVDTQLTKMDVVLTFQIEVMWLRIGTWEVYKLIQQFAP
jgi:hypothetical protein